jgi:phosphotransferase system HPr-like phosphotransfer protein
MSLNAKGNDVIEVIINGEDEDLALEKLKAVFEENL